MNLATNLVETSHSLAQLHDSCFIQFHSLVSMAQQRDFLKFHFAFPVIPVGKITALCYANLRPDTMSQDRHY